MLCTELGVKRNKHKNNIKNYESTASDCETCFGANAIYVEIKNTKENYLSLFIKYGGCDKFVPRTCDTFAIGWLEKQKPLPYTVYSYQRRCLSNLHNFETDCLDNLPFATHRNLFLHHDSALSHGGYLINNFLQNALMIAG